MHEHEMEEPEQVADAQSAARWLQDLRKAMRILLFELHKFCESCWVVGDDDQVLKDFIEQAKLLQHFPCPDRALEKKQLQVLYQPIIGTSPRNMAGYFMESQTGYSQ